MPTPAALGWLTLFEKNNNGFQAGGVVLPFTAAGALNVGDIVWISADMTVNKSNVAADHQKVIGVVVAGPHSSPLASSAAASNNPAWMEPVYDPNQIAAGVAASLNAGDQVLVCVLGIAYVVTAAAIAAGVGLVPDTVTPGRVKAASDPAVAAGATAVTSTAANGAIITGDGFRRGCGKLLEASGGAGVAKRALIVTF